MVTPDKPRLEWFVPQLIQRMPSLALQIMLTVATVEEPECAAVFRVLLKAPRDTGALAAELGMAPFRDAAEAMANLAKIAAMLRALRVLNRAGLIEVRDAPPAPNGVEAKS